MNDNRWHLLFIFFLPLLPWVHLRWFLSNFASDLAPLLFLQWSRFHQHFKQSYYECRSQKRKKYSQTVSLFFVFGMRGRFHKHFKQSFYSCRSQKCTKDWLLDCTFALLGSECVKTLHKILMKLIPVVNFFNILLAYFLYECYFGSLHVRRKSCWNDIRTKNWYVKCW